MSRGSGLSRLFASIDGASQATYERYRVGGDFAQAIRNLRHLQEAKERLGSETPMIVWKYLVNAFNEPEMDRAKEMADDLGIPIFFDLMHVTDPSWYSSLHKKSIEEETTQVEARISSEDLVVIDHSRQHQPPVEQEDHRPDLPKPIDEVRLHPELFTWCMQPFDMAFIHWNGHLFPCCNVYGDAYSLGNLFTDRLEDSKLRCQNETERVTMSYVSSVCASSKKLLLPVSAKKLALSWCSALRTKFGVKENVRPAPTSSQKLASPMPGTLGFASIPSYIAWKESRRVSLTPTWT